MQKKKQDRDQPAYRSTAETHAHTALVLLSLTTSCSQNYTQTKWRPAEKKESTATIWWCDCEGCAAVRFYVAVSDKHPQQRKLVKWTFLPVVFVLSHLFTGCDQRSHPLTGFIFLEVKVTVHQSPQYHKCLSTGHCDTGQPFVSSDKHHSHPLCGFRKHNLGKKYEETCWTLTFSMR